ncbi:hypothetical protein HanRHA438_Chr11g0503411 [Helianthus annuus]|nr:hypothetical protein HanRHA438_Chr11g0503411 [Helianthus annuus]
MISVSGRCRLKIICIMINCIFAWDNKNPRIGNHWIGRPFYVVRLSAKNVTSSMIRQHMV